MAEAEAEPVPSPLPPPYSACATPKHTVLVTALRNLAVSKAKDATPPQTPHTPRTSSPLARGAMTYDNDDDDFGPPSMLRLPTPHDRVKAYEHGRPQDIFDAIPGNTGVLASDLDVFASDDLVMEARAQRVGVRLSHDADTHLAGEVIAVGHARTTASARGPSARVLSIDTARGLASSAYFKKGQGHISFSALPPSSSPRTDVDTPAKSKRKHSTSLLGTTSEVRGTELDTPIASKRKNAPNSRASHAPSAASRSSHRATTTATTPPGRPAKRPKHSAELVASSDDNEVASPPPVSAARAAASRPRARASSAAVTSVVPKRAAAVAAARPASSTSRSRPATSSARAVRAHSSRDGELPSTFARLGVTAAALQSTALAKTSAVLIEHALALGGTYAQLLSHLITLDEDVTVQTATAQVATFYSARTTHRPAQLGFFIKTGRVLNRGVFKDFTSKTFRDCFWSWWNDLTEGVCVQRRGAKSRPGAIRPTADFDPMLWRGSNGFGAVVAALALWHLGMKISTEGSAKLKYENTPSTAELKDWKEAVQSVERIAAAMVDTLG
jgi:hypothetical protein